MTGMADLVVLPPVVMAEFTTLAAVTVVDFTSMPGVVLPELAVLDPVQLAAGTSEDSGLWTGYGPPTTVIGSHPGDEYIDLYTGNIYKLN